MTITGEHLRHLLGAGPNAALIVVEGRVEVIDDSDEDEQAGVLDAAVANLGG